MTSAPSPAPSLSISDFARATHVSVKMLRHYHQIGLLVPTEVDPHTGYRRYATLGSYATTHEISIDGPVREYYLRGADDTPDETDWRTEIGWPIFRADGPRAYG